MKKLSKGTTRILMVATHIQSGPCHGLTLAGRPGRPWPWLWPQAWPWPWPWPQVPLVLATVINQATIITQESSPGNFPTRPVHCPLAILSPELQKEQTCLGQVFLSSINFQFFFFFSSYLASKYPIRHLTEKEKEIAVFGKKKKMEQFS